MKEKDYEYQEKTRKIKLQQAPNDPLKNPKKSEFIDSTLKGLKSELGKPSLFVDPLSSRKMNPLASKPMKKPNDPLRKQDNFTTKSDFFEKISDSDDKKLTIIKNGNDGELVIKDRVLEFKNAEKKKEFGVWSGIRKDFVKIFDLKNMEHFINNVKNLSFFFVFSMVFQCFFSIDLAFWEYRRS